MSAAPAPRPGAALLTEVAGYLEDAAYIGSAISLRAIASGVIGDDLDAARRVLGLLTDKCRRVLPAELRDRCYRLPAGPVSP